MYVLGLSLGVGSSACLLRDGGVLFAAHEERLAERRGIVGFHIVLSGFVLMVQGY